MEKLDLFTPGDRHQIITGPSGGLEVQINCPEAVRSGMVAIICHPHPLHGGTMNNKVVTTVARCFRQLNILNIRFNYRGVGQSEGSFAHAEGETEDLIAVIRWIQKSHPDIKLFLAGFSFGAYVAYRAVGQVDCVQLISIAPAVNHYDFQVLPLPNCPWILIQGEQDELVPSEEVYQWLDGLSLSPSVLRFAEADHFFHGKLIELRDRLQEAMLPNINQYP